ncbi:EF-hand domain-containing protein [Desulfovibrio inopinatus]|uniref:EF-hand domain-containing protein n=1 Tax=Desulfovibrio inopinatus TaxID=102109 RepID=UPI0012EB8B9B|nr:EF-hand domain-containing protein [Desulfovibrio inopinatus]
MKKLLSTLFVLALVVTSSFALASSDADFDALDTNKDGKVSKDEFIVWYPVQQFVKADQDGDGYVVVTEWVAVKEDMKQFKKNNQ